MISSFSQMLRVTVALAGVVAANFAVTAGLLWLMQEWQPRPGSRFFLNQLHQVGFGILLSQVVLIGYWLGLADGRWYLRLVAAIAMTLATALAIHWAAALSPTARRGGDDDPWAIIGFILIAMMLTVSFVGFVLRRTRGWRLTWRQSMDFPVTHQFQIADALLWMIVISGALAAIRFVGSIEEGSRGQFLDFMLFTARISVVVLLAMTTVFATVRQVRAVFFLVAAVIAIGIAFAIPDIYRDLQRTWSVVTGPIAWHVYLSNAINAGLAQLTLVLAAMSGAVANCLALLFAGCRLLRPARSAFQAPA